MIETKYTGPVQRQEIVAGRLHTDHPASCWVLHKCEKAVVELLNDVEERGGVIGTAEARK
jgi:hypothetical protein